MKTVITLLLFSFFSIFPTQNSIAFSPSNTNVSIGSVDPEKAVSLLKKMTVKQIQHLLGRKLNLKERIGLHLLKRQHLTKSKPGAEEKVRSKKGKAALILGIGAFVIGVIPYAAILALPAAILAVVFGRAAIKANREDAQGRAGMILGIVFLGLFLIGLLLLIALIASIT